ncbi:MAG: transposase, partial [bacterium]
PATYRKDQGVRYWYGAYHVGGNRLCGRVEPKKGGEPWLAFVQSIRAQFPADQRIYLIEDNLSAHWTPDNRAWARAHNMSLVPTPTNASWLNPIECRFTELQDLTFSGSDHHEWTEVAAALDAAAEYRNTKHVPIRRTGRKVKLPLWKRH